MLLRISLIIAILAGLATLYFGHFRVAERITNLASERNDAQSAQLTAEANAREARADARKAREEEETAKRDLAEVTGELEVTAARLAEQTKRANNLDETLTKTMEDRNLAQQALAQWNTLGVTMDQVRTLRDQLYAANQEREVLAGEAKIMLRENNRLRFQLEQLIGEVEPEVEMPRGLVGRVVAVDPRYSFVVLNIGEKQGVVEDGRLLVNRNGKLVGKLQVTKVTPDQSIANIMPDWQQSEVMEGDQVIY
jgi:cell shape-determining protein MreC